MNDVRFALRQLLKSGGFTVIAIVTLAIGIGLNTSMFSLMNELLLRPLPYPDRDHLVRVDRTTPQEANGAHAAADVLELQRETADFLQLGVYRQWGYTLTEPGRTPTQLNGLRVSAEFFSVLGMQPALGRTFTPEENEPGHHVIVLSHDTWLGQFGGDPQIINRVISIDRVPTTVIGVMPKEFSSLFLWGPGDAFGPIALTEQEKQNRNEAAFSLVGRFSPALTLEQLNARLATVARRLAETRSRERSEDGLRAISLQAATHSPMVVVLSWMMLGLAGGVLMIVCSNLSSLQLARATARAREFAIRAALGASRAHLLRPLLVESLLLSLTGGALGLLVALWTNEWFSRRFVESIPVTIAFDLSIDWRVFSFALGASVVAGILFGVAPAWIASRVRVNDMLKTGARGHAGDRPQSRFRNAMIVFQFSGALVQLACAAFFIRGIEFVSARDPGWDTDRITQGIISLPEARYGTPEQTYAFYTRLQERLGALPGVENVAVGWTNPMYQLLVTRPFVVAGREPPAPGREPRAFVNGVNPTFLDTLGIRLVAGRDFTESDRPDSPPVVMINESMARALFPDESPLGHRLVTLGDDTRAPMEIVGVFADVGLAGNPAPQPTPFQVFLPLAQECWNYVTVSARSPRPAALVEPMRQTLATLDPAIPMQMLGPAADLAALAVRQMSVISTLLAAFGLLGLFLAALGLYGVIARLVVQRTPEIGIRLALGAQFRQVLWMVLGSGLRLTLIGAAIGIVLSFVLALAFRAFFAGGRGGIDYDALLAVTLLLLIVGLLACYLPARRATKISPLEALRSE